MIAARPLRVQRQECQCSIDFCHAPGCRPLPRRRRRLRPLGAGAGLLLRQPTPTALPLYEFSTCSLGAAPVRTTTGFAITPQAGLEALAEADTIVVPGYAAVLDAPPAAVTEALAAAAQRGARVISVCTGAFALAHAGLLDGRRAATHWGWAEAARGALPRGRGRPRRPLRRRGRGDDLGRPQRRHRPLPARDPQGLRRRRRRAGRPPHGRARPTARAARPSSSSARRPRTAARWSRPGAGRPSGSPSRSTSRRWRATPAVSPRTFARRFREETGTTPLQWLLAQRVLEARRLLEESDLPVEDVAWRSGFGTAASLRDHFRRATETTPTAYRRSFRPLGSSSGPI